MTKPRVHVTSRDILLQSAAPETATLGEILPGYVNHTGACVDGQGNVFALATQDGPSTGDVDVVLLKRTAANGAWSEVFRFTEAVYGKHGYGDLVLLLDGRLCCLLSERNAAGATVLKEYILSGLASPPSTGAGGVDTQARADIVKIRNHLKVTP